MSCTHLKISLTDTFLLVLLGLFIAAPAHAQTFSVVYNYGSQVYDPVGPYVAGIIAQGRDGNLYSSSATGGIGGGAAYIVTPAGALTQLFDFGNLISDGIYPYSGLTLGTDGNFYGTTNGTGGFYGTVFKLTPGGVHTTLYTFTFGTDGALPYSPPIQGKDGNFYGTTTDGNGGLGTIYKTTSAGTFTALYQFDTTHGQTPLGPLVQGTDGNFYGTTAFGGTNNVGVIFKITSTGKLTVLYNFDNTHGANPWAPLVQGSDGNFYGTTVGGGTSANTSGVVFKMTTAGKLMVVHNLNGTSDGANPFAGLVQATDGNFYGVNANGGAVSSNCPNGCGTVFKVTSKGVFSVIYNFDLTTGQTPYTTMFQSTNGLLYGTTESGGTANGGICGAGSCGVLFSVNIGAAPFVSTLTTSGKVGVKVGILGQSFGSSSVVKFGGVQATSVTRSGTTYLTATVPSGATTGSVTVTTSGGTLTSNKTFRVTPQITSFTPPSGPVGTSVTITGVSLTQTSKVTFGGVAATSFTVNSDTQVTATVPSGATTGKIAVTTPGGSATSTTSFTVTTP